MLVLVTDYPRPDGYRNLIYIHVRNKYYKRNGIDVSVLNFRATENYLIDGIPVITLEDYQNNERKYDILICHAPNIRNHYRFLRKNEKSFAKMVFFFHGHEVVKINAIYPKPYDYKKQSFVAKLLFQDLYDAFKLKIWYNYFPKIAYKSHFIFVSRWIYIEFMHWTRIKSSVLEGKYSIIHNGVGKIFEEESYKPEANKIYDFITIRGNIDGSSYCIDIVNKLAKNNPHLKFLIIGRGEFFNHVEKADNVTWMDRQLSHEDIIDLLDKSKCGLMPTRQDTQGVMTCEMAVFGLPVITSDIDVCHEILDDFENVELISNNNMDVDLKSILERLTTHAPYNQNNRYFEDNTSGAEVELYRNIWLGGTTS